MKENYRIYMDCCCINRPYDDTNDLLVSLEGQAVLSIAFKCFYDLWILIGSEIIMYEISKTPDINKKGKMLNLYSIIKENVLLNNSIKERASFFINKKIKTMDALHLACAEYANADVLLTTDIDFMKKAASISSIKIKNPVNWLMEVRENED
jgi:predicted nucleic acid-binding protein